MKKKLLVLFCMSALILLNGCGSSEKKKSKEVLPVVKKEVTSVSVVKPVVNEVKPEVKETPLPVKIETKSETKTEEKPNIIIVVFSNEEAAEMVKSIMLNGNYEIKGNKSEVIEIKKENKVEKKPEVKIETKVEPITEKVVKEEKKEIPTPVVAEKEIIKTEKKDISLEEVGEKIAEELNNKKDSEKVEEKDNKNIDIDKDGIPDYLDFAPNQILKDTLIAQGIQKVIITDDMKEADIKLSVQMTDELDKVIVAMKKDKTFKIKIIAHTNNIGDENVNLKLSEKRVVIAKNYLISKGIPADYVAVDWKGGSVPMVENDTKENRAKNKRLEVIFYIANIKVKK